MRPPLNTGRKRMHKENFMISEDDKRELERARSMNGESNRSAMLRRILYEWRRDRGLA